MAWTIPNKQYRVSKMHKHNKVKEGGMRTCPRARPTEMG
jgi:hypothetical protein